MHFLFIFVISVCQPLSHLLISIAYVRPPICLSITLCLICSCFSSHHVLRLRALWWNCHRNQLRSSPCGRALANKRGHGVGIGDWCSRSKDDYLKTVRSSWVLPIPLKNWRFFFDTQVATHNGLSTFEVEVPSVFELAAPPTCQNVKELDEVCMQWNQARNSSTVVQCRAQSQEMLRKPGQTNPEELVSIRTDMAK